MTNMHALIIIGAVVVILICAITIYHSIQASLDDDKNWKD